MGEFSIGLEFNFISQIAKYFGSPEDAFRLILSVVLGMIDDFSLYIIIISVYRSI